MTVASETAAPPAASAEVSEPQARRALAVACGAHALHDGYTDLIYVMLPIWQHEFAISYAALGLLRTCYSGTMASLQIPSGLIAERLGTPLVLALGTALAGVGYLVAGSSIGFWTLVLALLVGGMGSSTQHPLASDLTARAFAGPRSLKALGTYNFAGDIGKMTLPACASLMLVLWSWHTTLSIVGVLGLAVAVAIYWCAPRFAPEVAAAAKADKATRAAGRASRLGFLVLLAVGMIDSATRMGFLIFLPFLLIAKGASLPTVGLALTLVFAGGAAGKLVCAFIGGRIGVIATVCLTEGLTTAGILAMIPHAVPLEAALVMLPVIGVALNGTSSVLYGSVPLLVTAAKRGRAFSVFYTATIGAGATAPALYGLIGDALGPPVALMFVAGICLLTLPLALVLRPLLPAEAR